MEDSHVYHVNNLNQKSELFKEQLIKFQTVITTYRADKLLDKFKVETELLKHAFSDYIQAQTKVWPLSTSEEKNYFLGKCFDIENDYLSLLCEANELIREAEANAMTTANVSSASVSGTENLASSSESGCLYLPQLKLPKFSGRYEDWQNFADQFKSTIHDNRSLNDQMRLLYLRSCLDSKTVSIIQHLPNYVAAWKYLEELHLIEHNRKIRPEGNL